MSESVRKDSQKRHTWVGLGMLEYALNRSLEYSWKKINTRLWPAEEEYSN